MEVQLSYAEMITDLQKSFQREKPLPIEWRRSQLEALREMLRDRGSIIEAALHKDYGKPAYEVWSGELQVVASEIAYALDNLTQWMQPIEVTIRNMIGGSATIVWEPLGVVLIIGPWNFPIQLTLLPLIGAIGAGNCALLKPSEQTPYTSQALLEAVHDFLDPECIRVVEGGAETVHALLQHRFDHIFFTGGPVGAKAIMAAAAEHLTPVTLELGGKNPCIVDKNIDPVATSRPLIWGRFLNAGQVCVAPDYVLVHQEVEAELINAFQVALKAFFGDKPKESSDYARIVNHSHFQRLAKLLDNMEIIIGGEIDEDECYIAPTIVRHPPEDSALMREEIFGPILPVIAVDSIEQAIEFVKARPKPLSVYLFSNNMQVQEQVISHTYSGGVCVNDTVVHIAPPELPFGGVGPSGMGRYHGKWSFETFSHGKTVMRKPNKLFFSSRYPPHAPMKTEAVKRLI